jgi:hypothetical protein
VNQDVDTCGMQVLVLGTSNSIGAASYAEKTGAKLGAKITNLSVGACSSNLALYQLHKIMPVRRGVAFIDFAINDSDAGWNLWGRQNAPRIILDNIRTVVAKLRSANFMPILLVSASMIDLESEPYGDALHREICMAEGINFIDMRRLVLGAIERGASRDALMRDDYHISEHTSDELATFLATVIKSMNAKSTVIAPQSASIVQARVAYASELFSRAALVDRGSSLRSALHGRLAIGETLHIPMRSNERLRGMMVNVGAQGGTIALRSGEVEVIKSMTSYWTADHPEQFGSLLIDFAHPLLGGAEGVTIRMVGLDVIPTEPTIHTKSMLPGRYGEIEIEGVLLTECNNVQFDYGGPAYSWMPIHLGELSEAQDLADRLAGLRGKRS